VGVSWQDVSDFCFVFGLTVSSKIEILNYYLKRRELSISKYDNGLLQKKCSHKIISFECINN
jgi:hypothetical protein